MVLFTSIERIKGNHVLSLFRVSFTSLEKIKGDHVLSLFTILFTSILFEGSILLLHTTYISLLHTTYYYIHEFMNELGDKHSL